MLFNRIIPFLLIALFSTSSAAINGKKRPVDKYAKLRNALPYLRKEMSRLLSVQGQTVPFSRIPDVLLELLETVDQLDAERLNEKYQHNGEGLLTIEQLAQSSALLLGQTHIDRENILLNYAITLRFSEGALVLMEAWNPDENFTLLPMLLAHLLFAENFATSNISFGDGRSNLIRAHYRGASEFLLELCSKRNIKIPYSNLVARGWDLDSDNEVERNDQLAWLIKIHRGARMIINLGHAHVPLYTMRMTKGSLNGYLDATLQMIEQIALNTGLPVRALLETASVARLQAALPPGSLELIFASDLKEQTRAFMDSKCSFCPNHGELQCGRCSETRYCSQDCQKRHWPEHKKSCKAKK